MYGLFGFADKLNTELRKFNGKFCSLNIRIVWFCEEIEYPQFRKFRARLCKLYMYEMSGFEQKFNILNFVKSAGNCVR